MKMQESLTLLTHEHQDILQALNDTKSKLANATNKVDS